MLTLSVTELGNKPRQNERVGGCEGNGGCHQDNRSPYLTESAFAKEFLDLVAEQQVVTLLADIEALLVVKALVLRSILNRRLLGRELTQVVYHPEHSQ